jgi:hypothetical protein
LPLDGFGLDAQMGEALELGVHVVEDLLGLDFSLKV